MVEKAIHFAESDVVGKMACGRRPFRGIRYVYSIKYSTCKACARRYKEKRKRALKDFLTYMLFYA